MRLSVQHFTMSNGKMRSRIIAAVVVLGVQSLVGEVDSAWKEGEGGVQFMFKGQTYSFSSNDCTGGVLFKKPVDLDFVCPHGYFLQRPKGCSSSHEIIIAGEKLPCPVMSEKRPVRVQAFIPMTNPGTPTEHTIALYDDPDTLQGFRRYTLRLAKSKSYAGGFNGSHFLVVSNPRKIPETSIGPLCYRGISGANGAAYKIQVRGNLTGKNGKNLFQHGCDSVSVDVDFKDAKKFALADGFSKRFVRKATRKVDDRSTGKQKSNRNKRRQAAGTHGISDNSSISVSSLRETTYLRENRGASPSANEDSTESDTSTESDSIDKKDLAKKGTEGDSEFEEKKWITIKAIVEKGKGRKDDTKMKDFNDLSDSEEIDDNWGSGKSDSSEGGDTERLFHKTPESDLKETIVVNDHAQFVSPYFLEAVAIGRIRVGELLRGKNLSDPNVPTLFNNKKSNSHNTTWFSLMTKQVEVVETIVPETVVPRGLFQDALRVFSFMFRNLPDNMRLAPTSKQGDLEALLDSLSECRKSYESNPFSIEYDNSSLACPPKISAVNEMPSFLWNSETDSPQDISLQTEIQFPPQEPIQFRHTTFPGKTNLIVQLMFTVMDIAHVSCFKSFKPTQLNLHSKMTFYLMSNVFLSPEVHEYWKQADISNNIFASLLPHWNSGKSLNKIGAELDIIRTELRKATVYRSWITTDPQKYSMNKIPSEGSDNLNEVFHAKLRQRQAKEHVDKLIKSILYLENDVDDLDGNSTAEEGNETEKGYSTGIDDETKSTTPSSKISAEELVSAPQSGETGETRQKIRERRETRTEKLRHREIWNGLAYCLSLVEEGTQTGETMQLGIHPSLELLQTQIAC